LAPYTILICFTAVVSVWAVRPVVSKVSRRIRKCLFKTGILTKNRIF